MEEAILNIPVEDEENRNKHQMLIRQRYEELTNMAVENAWELIEEKSRKDKALDTVFVIRNRHVYCHSSILACRSQIFKRLAKKVDKSIGSFNVRLTKRQDNRIEVHIDNSELSSLLLMIDYIYTDEYEHPMKVFFCSPALSGEADVRKIQKDLMALLGNIIRM
ncbi:hypothetical protein G6F68_014432 [Rhizopus microsporus]|nr:hypothetical protein G6F68_014432 [Rhizopus microsporus]